MLNPPFIIYTHHNNLKCLLEAKHLNPLQARWTMFFSRFKFQISYRPGSKNSRVNALYRMYSTQDEKSPDEPILPKSIFSNPIQWKFISANAPTTVRRVVHRTACTYHRLNVPTSWIPYTVLWAMVTWGPMELSRFSRRASGCPQWQQI